MKKNYWEKEPDGEIDFGKNNKIRFWKSDGIVQFLKTYEKDGKKGIANTVAINLDALRECPDAMELMRQIFADIAV